jgi:hypothetical protein
MSMENSNLREERMVDVSQTGGFVRSERVVEDVSAKERQNVSRLVALIRWIFGVIEALIGLRILLELIAANPGNPFARLVYSFSDLFVRAFRGLTVSPSAGGIVLDVPAIVALLVYALVGWGISRLIWILFSRAEARRISVYERRRN